jgi:hypothetical protein
MVIEILRCTAQRHKRCLDRDPLAVVYFYCNRNEEQRGDPTAIMQAMVKQLSILLPESTESYGLPKSVVAKYDERVKEGFSSGPLGFKECQDLIVSLLDTSPKTTIVIDALDECDPTKRCQFLEALETIATTSQKLVKIFISSRDDDDIVLRLRNMPNLYIEATDNQGDIEHFVRREINLSIQKSRLLRGSVPDELRRRVVDTLIENARGM